MVQWGLALSFVPLLILSWGLLDVVKIVLWGIFSPWRWAVGGWGAVGRLRDHCDGGRGEGGDCRPLMMLPSPSSCMIQREGVRLKVEAPARLTSILHSETYTVTRTACKTAYRYRNSGFSPAHNSAHTNLVAMADLETAKNRLVEVLKERTVRYWELMKSWYRRRVRGLLFVHLF